MISCPHLPFERPSFRPSSAPFEGAQVSQLGVALSHLVELHNPTQRSHRFPEKSNPQSLDIRTLEGLNGP